MQRSVKRIAIWTGIIVGFVGMVASVMFVCNELRTAGLYEVTRVASPDGMIEAIVVGDTLGGLGGYDRAVTIYIEPSGKAFDDFEEYYFFAEKVSDLSLHWQGDQLLEIHYTKAVIFKFRNVYADGFGPGSVLVELKLVKEGNDVIDIFHD